MGGMGLGQHGDGVAEDAAVVTQAQLDQARATLASAEATVRHRERDVEAEIAPTARDSRSIIFLRMARRMELKFCVARASRIRAVIELIW